MRYSLMPFSRRSAAWQRSLGDPAPSILGGTDYTAFWSAPGYVTFIAQVAMVIWFMIASVSMITKGRHRTQTTTTM